MGWSRRGLPRGLVIKSILKGTLRTALLRMKEAHVAESDIDLLTPPSLPLLTPLPLLIMLKNQ